MSGDCREETPPELRPLLAAFLTGLRDILGENLVGLYLYGAMTFPDSAGSTGDVDFHVIVRDPLDERYRVALTALGGRLAAGYPPCGEELDGYYITLADTRHTAPPPHQLWPLRRVPADAAWALHCAHIRAGRCITLFGTDPLEIYPEPTWPDLQAALWSEVAFVDTHLDDAPAYCILNACRILYSFVSRDVVMSKRGAATWALERLPPDRHAPIESALLWYAGEAAEEDEDLLRESVRPFVAALWQEVARAAHHK